MSFSIALMCIALYLAACGMQYFVLAKGAQRSDFRMLACGWAGVVLHSYLLYRWIDVEGGQNLAFFNLFSFAVWLIGLWICLVALWRPVGSLGIFIFPLAAISIALAQFFPGYNIFPTAEHPKQLIHLLSATAMISIICMAALQSVLLALQEWLLRRKYTGNIINGLPPVETMESLLFQMVWLGFIALTLVAVSGMIFFTHWFQPPLLTKSVLVLLSWAVWAWLLAGRYFFNWRGRKVVYYTCGGCLLLLVIYWMGYF